MNRTDHKRLFADALAETAPAGFRESLLAESLRIAQRRRRWRQARRLSALSVLVILIGCFISSTLRRRPSPALVSGVRCSTVRTLPLSSNAVVSTRRLAAAQIIASAATTSIVQTAMTQDAYHEVNDEELLKLAGATSAVLVRLGPNEAELVFANITDQKGSN